MRGHRRTGRAGDIEDEPRARFGGVTGALRGERFGHAIHPVLTDFTNGPWMGASFLDLFGPRGAAPAAQRLVAFGLVSSLPTIATGLADWRTSRGGARRLGAAHAVSSSLATACYAASYLARRRGRHGAGLVWGLAGGIVAFVDGYVGGELSLVGRVGTGRRVPPEGS